MEVPRKLELPAAEMPETKQNGPAIPPSSAYVAALEQRDREQRDFLENAPVAMHWVGEDGTILWANRAELELLGYAREDYIGRNIAAFHMDETVILDILNRLKCNEELRGYEARLRCKDGSVRYVSINSSVYREEGRFVHTRCITFDIGDIGAQRRDAEFHERLSAIVESSNDAIISKDLNGIIRSWNRGAERIFGYASDEVLGKPITIIIPPDRLDEEPKILGRLQRGDRVDHFETVRKRKDGALLNVSLAVSPVKNAQGKVIGASKIARDITDNRRAEQAILALNDQLSADLSAMVRMQKISTRLVQAEDFRHLLNEILSAGVEITDADMGNIQLLEDGALKVVAQQGFDAAFLDFFDSVSHGLAACGTALERGERVIVEDVAESPIFAGTPALAVMLAAGARAVQSTPLVSRSSQRLGMFSTHYRSPRRPGDRELRMLDLLGRQAADLIERKQAEAALLESEGRFRQLADSMPEIVWTARPDGYIDYYNERWYEFTGLSRDQLGDESYEPLLHPDDVKPCHEAWYGAVKTGQPYRIEYRFRDRHENRWQWFMGRALPVREGRKIVKWFGSCTDIDEQKRNEEDLRRANRDLEQFAHSASHDLQEPLRMVSAYGELLKREFGSRLGATADEYIGYMIDGALRMEQLLKDLRAYTLASTSGQKPAGDTDAGASLDKALANLEAGIRESGASITRSHLPSVSLHDFQLEQLFQNLVGNAIRYKSCDPPQIHIAAARRGEEWLFSVQDNGIGIDSQYKEQIFELFQRLHSIAEYPGTGMGLAICQRIVERAGGRLWVESEPGRGSTFFFTVPCREA
jgi:PAS domain S-box-containing protein